MLELPRSALKAFNAIRLLDAPGPVKTALYDLVTVTSDFNHFVPFFISHALFQEILSLVHSTLEEFLSQHPDFERPPNYSKIAGLHARVQDSIQLAAKKGMYFPLFVASISFSVGHGYGPILLKFLV